MPTYYGVDINGTKYVKKFKQCQHNVNGEVKNVKYIYKGDENGYPRKIFENVKFNINLTCIGITDDVQVIVDGRVIEENMGDFTTTLTNVNLSSVIHIVPNGSMFAPYDDGDGNEVLPELNIIGVDSSDWRIIDPSSEGDNALYSNHYLEIVNCSEGQNITVIYGETSLTKKTYVINNKSNYDIDVTYVEYMSDDKINLDKHTQTIKAKNNKTIDTYTITPLRIRSNNSIKVNTDYGSSAYSGPFNEYKIYDVYSTNDSDSSLTIADYNKFKIKVNNSRSSIYYSEISVNGNSVTPEQENEFTFFEGTNVVLRSNTPYTVTYDGKNYVPTQTDGIDVYKFNVISNMEITINPCCIVEVDSTGVLEDIIWSSPTTTEQVQTSGDSTVLRVPTTPYYDNAYITISNLDYDESFYTLTLTNCSKGNTTTGTININLTAAKSRIKLETPKVLLKIQNKGNNDFEFYYIAYDTCQQTYGQVTNNEENVFQLKPNNKNSKIFNLMFNKQQVYHYWFDPTEHIELLSEEYDNNGKYSVTGHVTLYMED